MQTDSEVIVGLSERIREEMERAGISQRQLSKITGDPLMTINNTVNGRNMPGSGVLSRIAEALGTSADYLLFGVGKKSRRTA